MPHEPKRAKAKRKVLLSFFDEVKESVEAGFKNVTLFRLKLLLDALIRYYDEFQKVQSLIEDDDENEIDSTTRIDVDKMYFKFRPALEARIHELQTKDKKQESQNVPEELAFCPKLPDLKIDPFDGSPEKWKVFIESFNNHFHQNPKLNDMTKFQFLRNLTTGEGAKPIEALEFVSENYEEARRLLIERFDKPNQIAEHHIRSIFSVKRIERATSSNMLQLLDEFNSHLRSLKSLGRPIEYWDDLVVYLMITKLDNDSRAKWREFAPSDRLPTYADMSNFLKSRSHKLLSYKFDTTSTPQNKPISSTPKSSRFRSSFTATKSYNCIFCNTQGHSLLRCHGFTQLSIDDRRSTAEKLKLCFNCLRTSHMASKCPNPDYCRVCQAKHHTLLHRDSKSHPPSSSSTPPSVHTPSSSTTTTATSTIQPTHEFNSLSATGRESYVLLATAVVEVFDKFGYPIQARALLDSGSQVSFITESFASRLGIKSSSSQLKIRGIGCSAMTSSRLIVIHLRSRSSEYVTNLEVQILPKITEDQPSTKVDISKWLIPANIKLSDPDFYKPNKIDLLLGADVYYELQSVGQIRLGDNQPFLQNTQLGWVVSGKVNNSSNASSRLLFSNLVQRHSNLDQVDQILERFWELDQIAEDNSQSIFDSECDKHFRQTHARSHDGRFIVKLPFLRPSNELGDSSFLARKRFLNLERRLDKSSELRDAYNAFMSEYLNLKHMEKVDQVDSKHYYLPHHCVMKPDSSTTKLRVVFDGSAKTSSGVSLNDILMPGPVVQNDLFAILLRFRSHAFAFSADISKMYRQISLHESDQHYQYIFWRFNSTDSLETYKLNTVTYGTTSAPYLATRCLLQLSLDHEVSSPPASSAIRYDVYVDDILTGANSLEDVSSLKSSVTSILHGAGMDLRKWCANHSAILFGVPDNEREEFTQIDDDVFIKTLGLFWHSNTDQFRLNVHSVTTSSKITKRIVISEIARIFDPIGIVAPIVVYGKLIMQHLWQLKVDWDESLPMEIHTRWSNFRIELQKLAELFIPRHLFNGSVKPSRIQLHGFADASQRAYGAVLYVRSVIDSTVCVRLLCAKSRVAPLKQTTLPRLELCAAQLLANLVDKVTDFINFPVDDIYYWTDSTITICWIQSSSSRWKTFVANRVADIQSKSNPTKWRHIESKQNPADIISRGCLPADLVHSQLWWYGPSLLQSLDETWRHSTKNIHIDDDNSEVRKLPSKIVLTSVPVPSASISILDNLKRLTLSFEKFIRCLSYIHRYFCNLNKNRETRYNELSADDIARGTLMIVRLVQLDAFRELHKNLQDNPDFIVRDPSLKALSLFMGADNIIRIGGRLQFSALSYTAKHPALLPTNHFFSLMLVNFIHRKNLHVGPQGLLATVRQQYWPLNGRQLMKRICRECLICSRARPKMLRQQMASLPPERVQMAPPFFNVGIDYAGPFYAHYKIRGKVPTKTYLAVFVCFATKAVHLELASDLSTAAFLGAFRRFVSTRGLCKRVFSDNGTNFVGAKSDLHELFVMLNSPELQRSITTISQDEKIIWSFIPAGSPHFGGLHEAAVKSAKFHLRRVIGNANLSYEELQTIVKQAEATLNSRPLIHLGDDSELDVLTPGHFLIGRPLNAIPEPNLQEDVNINYLKRWDLVNHLFKVFWSRWSKEYLQQLQHRYYWQNKQPNLPIGSIVVIQDENQPPLKWRMGRVIYIHPGPDNLVRVATVKTSSGIIRRAITKLSPLPQ